MAKPAIREGHNSSLSYSLNPLSFEEMRPNLFHFIDKLTNKIAERIEEKNFDKFSEKSVHMMLYGAGQPSLKRLWQELFKDDEALKQEIMKLDWKEEFDAMVRHFEPNGSFFKVLNVRLLVTPKGDKSKSQPWHTDYARELAVESIFAYMSDATPSNCTQYVKFESLEKESETTKTLCNMASQVQDKGNLSDVFRKASKDGRLHKAQLKKVCAKRGDVAHFPTGTRMHRRYVPEENQGRTAALRVTLNIDYSKQDITDVHHYVDDDAGDALKNKKPFIEVDEELTIHKKCHSQEEAFKEARKQDKFLPYEEVVKMFLASDYVEKDVKRVDPEVDRVPVTKEEMCEWHWRNKMQSYTTPLEVSKADEERQKFAEEFCERRWEELESSYF